MKPLLRLAAIAAIVSTLPLAGCAGGWRNGVPPGATAVAPATAITPAPAAAPAVAAGGGTHAVADGVVFVWKGGGASANVAGEFNAWSTTADPLTKQADGSFTLTKQLAAGRYAYKFVVDGKDWKEDPSAKETVDDGYGGKNAIVVVGGAGAAPAPALAATPAPAAAPAVAAGGGTHAVADGAVFVWKGGGASANVAGEFNAWSTTADPLTKQADGSFTLTKQLAAGRYAYKFVVDGKDWKEDPSAKETVDDGYGGKNAIVVVGGAGAAPAPALAATPAPAAAPAVAAGGGTHAVADGAVFVWKGGGASANVAGEFNAWSTTADPLTKQADGSFTLTKQLAAGRYAYKFVVDGKDWKEDPSAKETVDDGYGGKNAIVVVGGTATVAAAPAAAAPATGKGRPPVQTAKGVVFTYAGGGSSVFLAGDFNAWSTTASPLTAQGDGTWTITLKIDPGTYGYKFVVDGTTWKMDPANPVTKDDGFGGKNSVVTVK